MRLSRKRLAVGQVAVTVLHGRLSHRRPTVLFVNAAGMAGELAGRVALACAAAGLNFVTWEQRGSPGPGTQSADCRLASHVADGRAVIRALQLRDVALAGWCTGGSVALHLAVSPHVQPRALVLIDAAMLFEGRPGAPLGDAMYAICGEIAADPAAAADYLQMLAPRGGEAQRLGLLGHRNILDHVTWPYAGDAERLRRYAFAIRAACAYNATEICRAVACPTLLLARRDDRMVSPRNSERAAGLIGKSALLVEPGGHYCLFTRPEPSARMTDFINAAR